MMTDLQIVKTIEGQPLSRVKKPAASDVAREKEMREMAQKFEASFISQMLKYSGLPDALESSGGQGTDAFTGFYLDQLANKIADQGGFGLAESIYAQLRNYEEQR